jgi:hypothetical protein
MESIAFRSSDVRIGKEGNVSSWFSSTVPALIARERRKVKAKEKLEISISVIK